MFLLTRDLRVEQALEERGVRDRVSGDHRGVRVVRMTALLLNLWGPGPLKVFSRSLTVRALVGSRPPLGDVWHAASGASQTSLRSTLNFAQHQERGLAACKTLANLPAALVDQKRERAEKASIYRSPYAQKAPYSATCASAASRKWLMGIMPSPSSNASNKVFVASESNPSPMSANS